MGGIFSGSRRASEDFFKDLKRRNVYNDNRTTKKRRKTKKQSVVIKYGKNTISISKTKRKSRPRRARKVNSYFDY